MAKYGDGRCEHDLRQGALIEQASVDVRDRRVPHPLPPRIPASLSPTDEDNDRCRHGQRKGHERDRRAQRRRHQQEDRDGQRYLDELSRGALPDDGPQGMAEVPRLAPVAHAAVHVPGDAARKREVQKLASVVGRDRIGQGQPQAEAVGHGLPPPGEADGGEEGDSRHRRKRAAVERPHTVEERAAAHMPDHGCKRGRRDYWTGPAENAPHDRPAISSAEG
ncbi:MAG TPA: hypothetical protein VMS60_11900 [Solirubrobacterales bacterium]|nr:hypothetical protein [Solirubrobacterales bacterium]